VNGKPFRVRRICELYTQHRKLQLSDAQDAKELRNRHWLIAKANQPMSSVPVLFLLFPPSASLPLCYPLLFAQLRLYLSYPKVPCLLLNGYEDLYPVKLALRARNIC